MGIFDRLSTLRQRLSGTQSPVEDERLMQLYWNRAELKKELAQLQNERHAMLEQKKKQDGQLARTREQLDDLEEYLGDPAVAAHALVYFQLRALWRTCAGKLAQFSKHLQRQQEERERSRQLAEFEQTRQRRLAQLDQQLADARAACATLTAQVDATNGKFEGLRGFWNYFRRRQLAEELADVRGNLERAMTHMTDLSDDRTAVEQQAAPELPGISIEARRTANAAIIAHAQQLIILLAQGGLAILAKEATSKRVFDLRYGSPEECARLMGMLRDANSGLRQEKGGLAELKERAERLRVKAVYRSDADTVPLTDSIDALSLPSAPIAGSDANGTAINVLVDDYWDVAKTLLR